MSQPLVSILCATYNQKDYIAQTIEGFLIQETSFPVEIIIHDDASTDGTADIVRKYEAEHPDLIKGIYQIENQYSKRIAIWDKFIYPMAKGKYIAECEGDDYWTDPKKLQRQIEFLESHPDYIYSHTSFKYYDQVNGVFLEDTSVEENLRIQKEEPENIGLYVLDHNKYRIQTATTVYRKELLSKITDTFAQSKYFYMGDTQLSFFAFQNGKIHFDPAPTAVYRLTPNSACHRGERNKKSLRFNLSCEEMRVYLSKYIDNQSTIQKFKYDFGKALVRYASVDEAFRSKIDESVIPSKFKFLLFLARHSSLVRWFIRFKGNYKI